MKISKSKQELARIISENGGWKDQKAGRSAQDGSGGQVSFFKIKAPTYSKPEKEWMAFGDSVHCYDSRIEGCKVIKNFHQTILSRAEYLHLYPAPDAKPEFCESVMRSIPEPEAKPTIEQLAADYRNAKDYAERKQQEADAAKADAEAKLAALELAGEALGLLVSPITAKQEPGLVITDWRDLQAGDEVEIVESCSEKRVGHIGVITRFSRTDEKFRVRVHFNGNELDYEWISKWRFIRRT